MNKTTEKTEKMVMVEGMMIAESKAEGRRRSKKFGRTIAYRLVEDYEKKRAILKADTEKNYTDEEITSILRTEQHQEMLDMGLGTIKRCSISCPHC